MKISEAILQYLKLNEVEVMFGIPAGTVSPIFDAMNDVKIQPIVTKNEGGAAYCAARYANLTKKLGVCIGAGGVGVPNMLNGILDAKRTKAPVLIISGYVNRWQIGKGAIQEQDAVEIFKPVTKFSKMVLEPEDVMKDLEAAIKAAYTVPQGPVFLSIPVDLQSCEFVGELPNKVDYQNCSRIDIDFGTLDKIVNTIDREKYGIIMVGKGCMRLSEDIMALSERLQWPIITTPSGKGVIPSDFALNLGNYGFTSSDSAEEFVEKGPATCVLALGTSMGEASTSNFNKILLKNRKLIHIDNDSNELDKVFEADLKLNADLKMIVPELVERVRKSEMVYNKPLSRETESSGSHLLSVKTFFEKIHKLLPDQTTYLCDIGEYMNFALKYLNIPQGSDFEFSINFGAMGSAIGGAPGAYFANPEKKVAVFAGDGCFFMNGMEILTAKEYNLPIIYFIINNSMLGYVEHGHQYLYGRSLECFKQERISITEMAKAMDIRAVRICNNEEITKISEFISNMDGPCLIELVIDGTEPPPIVGRLKALKQFNEAQ